MASLGSSLEDKTDESVRVAKMLTTTENTGLEVLHVWKHYGTVKCIK